MIAAGMLTTDADIGKEAQPVKVAVASRGAGAAGARLASADHASSMSCDF